MATSLGLIIRPIARQWKILSGRVTRFGLCLRKVAGGDGMRGGQYRSKETSVSIAIGKEELGA